MADYKAIEQMHVEFDLEIKVLTERWTRCMSRGDLNTAKQITEGVRELTHKSYRPKLPRNK